MPNFNKIILIGHLTRDPQTSYLPSQTAVCEFGLAVNEKWKDKDGNQQEKACFIDARIYGKPAEVFQQYMTKGKPVLVEGTLQFDQWEKDGVKHSKHRVKVDRFTFLGDGGGKGDSTPASKPAPKAAPQSAPPPADDFVPF